jgi:hypothetical protein
MSDTPSTRASDHHMLSLLIAFNVLATLVVTGTFVISLLILTKMDALVTAGG